MTIHAMFAVNGLASLQPFSGLGEQDAGAAANQQQSDQEPIDEYASQSPYRVDLSVR